MTLERQSTHETKESMEREEMLGRFLALAEKWRTRSKGTGEPFASELEALVKEMRSK